MAYLTLSEFTGYIGSEIFADEPFLARCLAAAEDSVNDHCARSFDVPAVDAVPTTRTYVPTGNRVVIHDLVDDTALTISDDGTDITDIQLEPVNRISWQGLAQPIHTIRRLGATWTQTYRGEATVSVTSTRWGWPALPPEVKEATAILAKDLAHVRLNRFGIAGFGEFGVIRVRDNPHVKQLLAHLIHPMAVGVA